MQEQQIHTVLKATLMGQRFNIDGLLMEVPGLNYQRLLFHVQMSQHQQVHVQTILENRHLQLLSAVVLMQQSLYFSKLNTQLIVDQIG